MESLGEKKPYILKNGMGSCGFRSLEKYAHGTTTPGRSGPPNPPSFWVFLPPPSASPSSPFSFPPYPRKTDQRSPRPLPPLPRLEAFQSEKSWEEEVGAKTQKLFLQNGGGMVGRARAVLVSRIPPLTRSFYMVFTCFVFSKLSKWKLARITL